MSKPKIGIILDHGIKKMPQGGYANFPWYALRAHYSEAVLQAGGIPLLLPYEDSLIQDYLKICDGLLSPGGDIDISPTLYQEEVSVENINSYEDNPRVDFESKIFLAALEKKLPIFGICAGMQLLNIVLGGSLYQDIAEQTKTTIIHSRHSENDFKNVHPIEVEEGSLLNKITGKTNYIVNSFHHQAIKKLGRNLKVSAVAPDGIIEGIEMADHPFCIGVEWHPEFLGTDEDIKLFRAFILAAQKHKHK